MIRNSILDLLKNFVSGKTTLEEDKKIDNWYNSVNETDNADLTELQLSKAKEEIFQKINAELKLKKESPVIPFYRKTAFKAAAIFIGILLTATFLLKRNIPLKNEPVENKITAAKTNDIKPPSLSRAILKLADGTIIQLDSNKNGVIAVQGSMQILKTNDGKISYKGIAENKITYNTLSVPRGSIPMKLVLADETEVWLNVGSSITYPTAFAGSKRTVQISGEAYFEVSKNKQMPFVVKKTGDDVQIEVLGTHFNVNAYDDEPSIKVTLLEGSVDVLKSDDHSLLAPGQQAIVTNAKIKVINDVDLEEVMAWKNGRFYFDGADIKTVMRQLEKWYNVQVVYQSDISYSFVAKISRYVNVSDILTIFERTDLVHFKVDGTKITVTK